jgi:hypothetical protein
VTLEVRRIVTGHNEFGMGIVVSDEKLSAVSRGLGANISGCEIWSTNSMPVGTVRNLVCGAGLAITL